ncbi:hypothetical protein [Paracoccus sp. SY]|uniref:hypothetical protein n=1 Tax=Paracoccus sp. SY TaxID=1330255 RepID=UPI000CD3229C|nr:hypothetical protein [Paracoccus sp. SY]
MSEKDIAPVWTAAEPYFVLNITDGWVGLDFRSIPGADDQQIIRFGCSISPGMAQDHIRGALRERFASDAPAAYRLRQMMRHVGLLDGSPA